LSDDENDDKNDGLMIESGSIIDSRRHVRAESEIDLPHIANAFYVARGGFNYGNSSSGSKTVNQASPLLHSYRVYSAESPNTNTQPSGLCTTTNDSYSSVPIKPILMCFICKLSFGYSKSLLAHATGEHRLTLTDKERNLLHVKNISAIVQVVGKEKEVIISFLEPLNSGGVKERGNLADKVNDRGTISDKVNDRISPTS
jgi:AT-binding transcription factor 1